MLHFSSAFCVITIFYLFLDDLWQSFVSTIYMVTTGNVSSLRISRCGRSRENNDMCKKLDKIASFPFLFRS